MPFIMTKNNEKIYIIGNTIIKRQNLYKSSIFYDVNRRNTIDNNINICNNMKEVILYV